MTTATMPIPPAYAHHPYASEECRRIAVDGLILRVEVGSGTHGIVVPGTDDRDELGVCIEPPEYVTGLRKFEQFQRHTAWDRGGLHEKSGPGDLDITIYSARKFCRLAMAGNPSILVSLFATPEAIVDLEPAGAELLRNAERFVSRAAADRFLGYLHRQRLGMTGEAGAKVKRPALMEKYGYDTKYAAHAVRLGLQGVELMQTGHITLPIPEPYRSRLLEIREGHIPLNAVLGWIETLERTLRDEAERTHVREHPDHEWIDQWLHQAYTQAWAELGY